MVLNLTIISAVNQLLESPHLKRLRVVPPFTILSVMSVYKCLQISVELAVEMAVQIIRCASVQLMHQFVNKSEEVQIVDSLFGHCSLENHSPHLFIVPLYVVKLLCQVKECPLIVTNFTLPELNDDFLEV